MTVIQDSIHLYLDQHTWYQNLTIFQETDAFEHSLAGSVLVEDLLP